MSDKQYDFLDIIALASFVVGMANYEENISQTQVNDLVREAVDVINKHLEIQDQKLDFILEKLGVSNFDSK